MERDLTRREAVQVVEKLKEKTIQVKGKWIGHYCLIAKSIEGKNEMEFLTFDLADIERAFQK